MKIESLNEYGSFEQDISKLGTPRVNINPYKHIINNAVRDLSQKYPRLFYDVSDINVNLHSPGVLGRVSSDQPNTVELNIFNLEKKVKTMYPSITKSDPQFEEVLQQEIEETLIHEVKGHMLSYHRPTDPFAGELAADKAEEEYRSKHKGVV